MTKKQKVLDLLSQIEWVYYEALQEKIDFDELDEYEIVYYITESIRDTVDKPKTKLRVVK